MGDKVYDVAVIGSGPAGLTAAIYTTRGSASTLVLAGEKWGGQLMLTSTVDNFPGFPEGIEGPDLLLKMRKQAERFGAEVIEKNATEVDFSKTPFVLRTPARPAGGSDFEFTARSVVIATGAETVWLDAPGIREFIGRGVSSCAPCDAPFFKDKRVAVVGGGDAAMEEALILTKYASEVMIVHRRDQFRASKIMQEKVLNNPKIKVLWNTEVEKVEGAAKVESLSLSNQVTKETKQLEIDGVFIAIGHKPMTEIFKGQLELDEKGYIKKVSNFKFQISNSGTSVPGVFVAGDVHDSTYKQAITAAGFGCQAAMDALSYLEKLSN